MEPEADPLDVIDAHGRLRPEHVEGLLFEVSSGKTVLESGGVMYASRTPTVKEGEAGRLMYLRKYQEGLRDGLRPREELERMALRAGVFEQKTRNEKAQLIKHVENLQRVRELTRDYGQKLTTDTQLLNMRKRLGEIAAEEQQVFCHSAEHFGETWRTSYLVAHCTMAGEMLDRPVWSGWEEFLASDDATLVADASRAFVRIVHGLPTAVIRALARHPSWRAIWKSSRESGGPLFEGAGIGWDANKRNLVWWSDFYDSVYRHADSPHEETINNDEALQDWLNQQLQRQQAERAKRGSGGRAVYQRDGSGQRKVMQKVGGHTINVGQSYKIPVPRS